MNKNCLAFGRIGDFNDAIKLLSDLGKFSNKNPTDLIALIIKLVKKHGKMAKEALLFSFIKFDKMICQIAKLFSEIIKLPGLILTQKLDDSLLSSRRKQKSGVIKSLIFKFLSHVVWSLKKGINEY